MKKATCSKELENEREKLDRLVGEVISKVVPFSVDPVVLEQSRKVDALVVKLQKEKLELWKEQT